MRCTVTQLARESVGLCPLSWFVVMAFKWSHSNRVNRIIKITHAQFAREDVGLWPFYNQNFLTQFKEITSASLRQLQLNYVSCNVKVDSLTFINFQENYQTAELYFCSYHFTPLNKAVSNYCVT